MGSDLGGGSAESVDGEMVELAHVKLAHVKHEKDGT
jgi:hypothetical protein